MLGRWDIKKLRHAWPAFVFRSRVIDRAGRLPETTTEKDQRVWLRRVFLNNLLDELRKLRARKRDGGRERSLDVSINGSDSRVHAILASNASTPSVKVGRVKQAELLLQAIATLPPLQRAAIELHHPREKPLEEIARSMDRPESAIAALIYRGMTTLKASKFYWTSIRGSNPSFGRQWSYQQFCRDMPTWPYPG